MSLTPQQDAIIKAWILADPELSVLEPSSNAISTIQNKLNLNRTPDFYIWKTKVTQDEIMQNGFDWTRVDNLSVGKARIWQWMFDNAEKVINPSKANVRAGIDATWVGTAADLAVRAVVYAHCYRLATNLEKLFATGTGTTVSPGDCSYFGGVTYYDILRIMGW
jgi:hypothetical protein